jgi:hypothetical protein
MARVTRRKREDSEAKPPGFAHSLLAFFQKYPLATGVGVVSAIISGAVGILEIRDRLPAPPIEDGLRVALVETELAPLSGGTMMRSDSGARIFSTGVKLRAQFSLKDRVHNAVINAIALAPIEEVPPEVVVAAQAGDPSTREPPSWAGARPVNTYLGAMEGGTITVGFNNEDGKFVRCQSENLLNCGDRPQVIELSESGDLTHTLDLRLVKSDAALRGVQIIANYSIDGVDHETHSEPLYLRN